ncbi:MAG: single-stranded-DNA-specific exonuclease RecJ [Bacteroidia bacterium]
MLLKKKWIPKTEPDKLLVEKLSRELGIKPLLSTLIAHRNLLSFEEARQYFTPDYSALHNPFLMKGMERAVERIADAIQGNHPIMVYGDYDVDGTTSVALVYTFLSQFSEKITYYIPDRQKEGYGISTQGIDYANDNGIGLIIALDCGIKSVEKVDYAKSLGIDFIICDHHTPGEELPGAVAILNPKQEDCPYPYKELSGCGIGFKLVQALSEKQLPDDQIHRYLDLVVTSIASDIVPLTGENRLLAHFGLEILNHSPRPGLEALLEISGTLPPLSIGDIVFRIGPRINAVGRMAHANEAVRLLCSQDIDEALAIARIVDDKNTLRQSYDASITEEAIEVIECSTDLMQRKSTVLFNPAWHKGVIGIVASRLIEHFYRPTVLLTESNGMAVGSARSVRGFDLYTAISGCSDLLEQFGGHRAAAGMTLKKERIEEFRDRFEEVVTKQITGEQLVPVIEFDAEVKTKDLTHRLLKTLHRFGPFGPENMRPVFVARQVKNRYPPKLVGDKHLKLCIDTGGGRHLSAIGFKMGILLDEITTAPHYDICFTLERNEWNGKVSLQLNLKDVQVGVE